MGKAQENDLEKMMGFPHLCKRLPPDVAGFRVVFLFTMSGMIVIKYIAIFHQQRSNNHLVVHL